MAATQPIQSLADSALSQLAARAKEHKPAPLNYGGDVDSKEAFTFLSTHGGVMVDVRTSAEWQLVGMPDLAGCAGKFLAVSWKTYPTFAVNPQFIGTVAAENSVTLDTPLFFICRSGGRSLDAAVAMSEAGYRHCFNVAGGFEGEPDADGHRGTAQGWKASQLPWKQG